LPDFPRHSRHSASRAPPSRAALASEPTDVLARLGRGEDVDPSEYTFRAAAQIETTAPEVDWLNKGIFISAADLQAAVVTCETYLVKWAAARRLALGQLGDAEKLR
jgi:Protein of unknown function (DUF3237)